MVLGMRAFRFTVFLALSAGLLSAAGYLWAPLVSPKAAPLRLAAPLIRSQVITPFHVAPVDFRVAPVRLVPLRIVGTLHLQRPRVVAPHVVPAPAPVIVVNRPAAPVTSAPVPSPPPPVVTPTPPIV